MATRRTRRPRKLKKIEVSVLNITTMPHSPERYRKLLRACYDRRVTVPYRGNTHAMIGLITNARVDGIEMLAGQICVFDEVGRRWFDTRTREEASAEVLQLIEVPEHVKPNFENFQFLFDAEHHRLAFDANLGPGNAERIFRRLFKDEWIVGEFGDVDVTLVQETEALQRIFEIPELRKLTIHLARPNPDDLEEVEEEVRQRLESNHAGSMEWEFVARPGESLTPDKEVRTYAEVALSNGYVKGKGATRDGITVEESTKAHPRKHTHTYVDDDNSKTIVDRFREAASALLGRRVKRRKRGN